MKKNDLEKINSFEWLIPKTFSKGLHVPVLIFADEEIIERCLDDKSLHQAVNATYLPGVLEKVCVMPDVHQGYGFPIGGVAATDVEHGVISPGAIGYDINCGVRLLSSNLLLSDVAGEIETLIGEIYSNCPSGVGVGSKVALSKKDLMGVCSSGANWAVRNGYGYFDDLDFIEDSGSLVHADPSALSEKAVQRGLPQLGSLGSGNHFIEINYVAEIFDEGTADVFGLKKDCLAVQIHSGSRGLGHQVCSDYVRRFQREAPVKNMPDRELASVMIESSLGKEYFAAMCSAANYAFANRQILTHFVRKSFKNLLFKEDLDLTLRTVYDLAHNIAKIEEHDIAGEKKEVCVHRKGATRAFGPGHRDLPDQYQPSGQPVLLPGSMGTSSWVMAGTEEASEKSFSSCSHGAGRVLSRSKAKKMFRGESIKRDLKNQKSIEIKSRSMSGLAEEAPGAYKDINQVVNCVEQAGLARRVAKLKPVAVIKG